MSTPRKLDPRLKTMLHGLAQSELPAPEKISTRREKTIQTLRANFARMHNANPTQFRPGDLVRWQPGLKNAKWPEYGESAVVVECLDPPIVDDDISSGWPHFREPLSLVLGLWRDEGFHCWHYDGRRFERVQR